MSIFVYMRRFIAILLAAVAALGCSGGGAEATGVGGPRLFAGGRTGVLVVGGGAGGTAAGVQAARSGARTTIVASGPWLGGMLTEAGVSAIDGNERIAGGVFREFVDSLAARYGGRENLFSGWVSTRMFEPHVGAEVLESIAAGQPRLRVIHGADFVSARKLRRGWAVTFRTSPSSRERFFRIRARVLIDGTELGDVAKACGACYHIGMDPRSYTGEALACEEGRDIIQDLTYVITVQNYGPGEDRTIPRPEGYDSTLYLNCCLNPLNTPVFEKGQTLWSPDMMLSYGQLPGPAAVSQWSLAPGAKAMLNWPVEGNDFYADLIDVAPAGRAAAISQAKLHALGYLYFIQTGLGLDNIGIAEGEYPTEDGLPMIPYYRESRRIEGEVLFTFDDAADPYASAAKPCYRAGVAVGDYPVDHHHFACPDWRNIPSLALSPIPSFTVPLGVLLPVGVEDLIVAEKSVSVSNIINGATRLQPVVMELGQAAGALAALSLRSRPALSGRSRSGGLRGVSVREVQSELLAAGCYLQPYLDLRPGERGFDEIQRIGSTGIMRGVGRSVDWSDETWFRAADTLREGELFLDDYPSLASEVEARLVPGTMTRLEAAVLLDSLYHPFERFPVSLSGALLP